MKKTFVITGASGYLGAHLTSHLLSLGHKVISLGTTVKGASNIPWRLGEDIKYKNFDQVHAVFHLAHVWNDKNDINYKGTMILLEAFRKSSCRKFIFASSISSKKETSSIYGFQKWKIEQELNGANEISVRIGLVYGGNPDGLWKSILKIIKFFPILPMINPELKIQPLHVIELNKGFVALALSQRLSKKNYALGLPDPITFALFLKAASLAIFNRNIYIFKISPILIIKFINFLNFFGFNIGKDRLNGMINLPIINNGEDLHELNIEINRPFGDNKFIIQKLHYESLALLGYIGVKLNAQVSQQIYIESVKKFQNGYPLFLPSIFLKLFLFSPIFEPIDIKSVSKNSFGSRLNLAYLIAETIPSQGALFYDYKGKSKIKVYFLLFFIFIKEILTFPLRVIINWFR